MPVNSPLQTTPLAISKSIIPRWKWVKTMRRLMIHRTRRLRMGWSMMKIVDRLYIYPHNTHDNHFRALSPDKQQSRGEHGVFFVPGLGIIIKSLMLIHYCSGAPPILHSHYPSLKVSFQSVNHTDVSWETNSRISEYYDILVRKDISQ